MVLTRRHATGFSMLELVVVGAILAVLGAALLQALRFAQAKAEKQGFNNVLVTLQKAVSMETLRRASAGLPRDDAMLGRTNPFQWIEPKPLGWAGEYPKHGRAVPGAWYWDSGVAQVVYVPQDPARLDLAAASRGQVRLHIELGPEGNDAHLLPITPYSWR